jgi:thioredoxin-related protein
MKKILSSLFIFFFIQTLNAASLEQSSLKYAASYKEAIELGKKQKKNVLLFTYSPYCPWCTKMTQTTFINKKVIQYVNKNYIFVGVDINKDKYPSRFKPNGVPTTYIIDPQKQKKLISMRGYKSAKSFYSRISM